MNKSMYFYVALAIGFLLPLTSIHGMRMPEHSLPLSAKSKYSMGTGKKKMLKAAHKLAKELISKIHSGVAVAQLLPLAQKLKSVLPSESDLEKVFALAKSARSAVAGLADAVIGQQPHEQLLQKANEVESALKQKRDLMKQLAKSKIGSLGVDHSSATSEGAGETAE